MKNIFKWLIAKGITMFLSFSGLLTGIVILFIVFFLFKEGAGLFNSPEVEKGYGLYLNASNPVEQLSPSEIKQIFDSEIKNWEDFGGKSQEIKLYRIQDIFKKHTESEFGPGYELLPEKLEEVIAAHPGIIAFLPKKYAPQGNQVRELKTGSITIPDFFFGKQWIPTASPAPLFGWLPLIAGTLLTSLLAILFALPMGLGVATYLAELAHPKSRNILKPLIELLAGIPSVVYGFFGLVIIAPLVQKTFNLSVGETALTGSILLAIMALPTIISVAEDALANTPRELKEASLALGATKWQTIYKVTFPYARSGIIAALVLGIGRAIGETMAVLMVTGNAAVMPVTALESVRTIPATLAAELGEAPTGGAHYQSLFLLGCILFLVTMLMSLIAEMISKKHHKPA